MEEFAFSKYDLNIILVLSTESNDERNVCIKSDTYFTNFKLLGDEFSIKKLSILRPFILFKKLAKGSLKFPFLVTSALLP